MASVGPSSLADLKKGANVDGDDGSDPSTPPPWHDPAQYELVHTFFKDHLLTLVLMWHCSLTIGFSLPALLEALVFTGDSNTPKKALARYMLTFKALFDWHDGK